ncbi:MAG: ribosome maturation protein [Methanolobus sp.]|jgi:ribosome maturation protein SDO1|uniref:rRNA metabolism protein, SBDS family n=1 Tax=Methanolobus tindarius DSM 2278 TaxID=1090322 RepID=W9DTX2_METTI|nr:MULTISPECIES: ribosome assembly factor SBDS [Methanolobus]ETA67117.1 rRNA metabolism protein, SBDS family [Methanolobus tindarius DSM 2278]MDI3485470.1 ribosome maturation protein [Methanolobus sp.]MDK2832799.1 ribosome maturation protein [Methanolobus sp.]MDK2939865.1 ribosome maturation protein [Methanolobus sp.]
MVSLDESVIARLKKGKHQFEVLVEPEGAFSLKRGEDVKMEDIIAVESVFTDAAQGDHAGESELTSAFETNDVMDIARQIILHGELQLTKEQRKQILEEKTRQVITIIAQNAINPQTRTPHPPARIEKAMEEAKIHIDPLKGVDEQVNIVMKAIRPIIPIRFEEVDIAVKIPGEYAAKSYGDIANFGTLVKNEWQNDGSWVAVVKMPAGLQNDFYGLVNHLTKGDAETKLL